MKNVTRRNFLAQTSLTVALAPALHVPTGAQPAPVTEKLGIGLIGPGGHGTNLLNAFLAQPDTRVTFVCDPDKNRCEAAARTVEQNSGQRPRMVKDFRQILDDKSVQAVVIATPDHWHGPAAIMACDAGKHVYVEKPCSHNIREGRLMVEAARRNKRVVQVGMQSRSAAHVKRAMELLRDGAIGEVLVAKAWNSQLRRDIGKVKPSDPPAHLEFDLWLGPAPKVPYQSNMLHGSWRWFRAFGTGDMGNDGVHDIDLARWGLGMEQHPSRVSAMGGKYFFDDDQQFPDTQYVCFEYASRDKGRLRQLIFEQRIWSPYFQEGYENGNAFYGTKGMLILGKQSGWELYAQRNKLKERMQGSLDLRVHVRDFLDAIKQSRSPAAEIQTGHLTAALTHLGNIATTVGRVIHFSPANEQITGDTEAGPMVRRTYRADHWAVPKGV
jgi:predicted dehydrogenase